MNWGKNLITDMKWSDNIINREGKERVAIEIASKVKNGEVVGAGSGSTVYLALIAIAERVKKENLDILIIPASLEISMTCSQLQIPQTNLMSHCPDWVFDGADEVDPDHNLIKGRGGAMYKEKLLICNSSKTYIIVDESKFVDKLGSKFPVPVEVFPISILYVEQKLKNLGATNIQLRMAKGKDGPIITENGNFILDAHFDEIKINLEKEIKSITGVLDSGLFINYNIEILVS